MPTHMHSSSMQMETQSKYQKLVDPYWSTDRVMVSLFLAPLYLGMLEIDYENESSEVDI